ncbi:MAG TPA: hypothetical protein PLC04_07225 [Candidatus Kapabacteria bacterium]|jgi:hypothetical protein|nr:hypothetical protein [Candidatus Kapabacteria bacterium]
MNEKEEIEPTTSIRRFKAQSRMNMPLFMWMSNDLFLSFLVYCGSIDISFNFANIFPSLSKWRIIVNI